MLKRLAMLLAALAVLGFVVAGCGDDDDGGSGSSDTPTETEKKEDTAGGGAVDTDDPRVKQAIEQCKKQADANSQLSAEAKDKIGEACDEAASGDTDAAVKATKEACVIIVQDTVPKGNANREQALAACDQVGAGQ